MRSISDSALLACCVKSYSFAVDRSRVRGIEDARRMKSVEGEWPMIGALPSGTGDVPVFHVFGLAGEPASSGDVSTGRLLLCAGTGDPFAIHVDDVRPLKLDSSVRVLPIPVSVGSPGFRSLLAFGNEILPLLDLDTRGAYESACTKPGGSAPRQSRGGIPRLLLVSLESDSAASRPLLCGVPETCLVEVLEGTACLPIPGARSGIVGVRLWQGQILAVRDLQASSVQESHTPGKTLVLTMPSSPEVIGLRVYGSCRLVKLPVPHVQSQKSLESVAVPVRSVIETDFATVGLIDYQALVS